MRARVDRVTGRKRNAPIYTKFEATTQTCLASTEYHGRPGEPVELYHVIYPRVQAIQPKPGGKGGKSRKGVQSAHVPAPYKKSGSYTQFKVKKVKQAEVKSAFDKFGKLLDKKRAKLTQAQKKLVSQQKTQDPGQRVGWLIDDQSLHVEAVQVVGHQPPATDPPAQALEVQQFIRAPCGELPTVGSGQFQLFVTGPEVDEALLASTSALAISQVDDNPLASTSASASASATSPQIFSGSSATSGIPTSQLDQTLVLGPASPSVEAVSTLFGLQLTPEEQKTVEKAGNLAAAGSLSVRDLTLSSSAISDSAEPAPDSLFGEQPDFESILHEEGALFVQPWDLWGFDFDVGRLEFSHPDVFSGDVTQEPTLPSQQGATEEQQGPGWTSHLPEEFWDIRPILCDDESS